MKKVTVSNEIPVKKCYDIVVCGGGVAGCAAALQAARLGKKVLLIEKSVKLGGLATLGLINFFVPMCNGRGKQIIFGMAEEFLRLAIKNSYDNIPDFQDTKTHSRYCTDFSAEIFALELTNILYESGVDLLFDSVISGAIFKDGFCNGVIVENKSGKSLYEGKMFIEATGDCDLLRKIGLPVLERGNYHTFVGLQVTLESCKKACEKNNIKYALSNIAGGNASLYGDAQPDNLPLYSGTDADDVNRYIITNHREMLKKLEQSDRFTRNLICLPGMVQFRTTACMKGDYVFTENDAYRHFEDSVCAINDFDRNDFLYEVPFRSMINKNYKNIIATGRCVCAEGYGWDVIRVIPPAILTGQAAGCATSIAIDSANNIAEVNINKVQATLTDANVTIHFDDSLVPETSDTTHLKTESI